MPKITQSDSEKRYLPLLILWKLPDSVSKALSEAFSSWHILSMDDPTQLEQLSKSSSLCAVCLHEDERVHFPLKSHAVSMIVLTSSKRKGIEKKDFLLKLPFSIPQFSRVLSTALIRAGSVGVGDLQGVRLNIERRALSRDGKSSDVSLTDRELALVKTLLELGNSGADKAYLLQHVWQYESVAETQTLETHISRIRQKLSPLDLSLVIHQGRYSLKSI